MPKVPSQDNGHLHRLELTRLDFKSCFPNITIEIDIEYDQNLPVLLTILKKNKNDKLISRETYSKNIIINIPFGSKEYDEIVECKRITHKYTFTRLQSFKTYLSKWLKI